MNTLPELIENYIYEFLKPDMSKIFETINDIRYFVEYDSVTQGLESTEEDIEYTWEYEDLLDQWENNIIEYYQYHFLKKI